MTDVDSIEIEGLELADKVGEGANSVVYRAVGDRGDFAVKLQRPDDSKEGLRSLHREGATLGRLEHPSLPRVWSMGTHRGRKYLVMDYFGGETLEDRLRRDGLEEAEIVRLAWELAAGLSELHGAGLVHRDIKPSNIVWESNRARLVDFGLVAGVSRPDAETERSDRLVGTFEYAAPEQLRVLKRPVGPRADLYSLGAILYECCAGRPPFSTESVDDLMQLHATETVQPVADRNPAVSDTLARVVDALLAKEPESRPSSARDVCEELGEAAVQTLEGEADRERYEFDRRPRRRDLYLTGREEILSELESHASACRRADGGGRVLVRGDARSGGEFLLEDLRRRVEPSADVVMTCTGMGFDAAPLEGVRQLLRSLVSGRDSSGGQRDMRERLVELADEMRLSTAARRLLRGPRDWASDARGESSLEPNQFYGELARFLVEIAAEFEPAVYLVGHVEGLDAASRAVLRKVDAAIDHRPVWVCFMLDPTDAVGAEFARELDASVGDDGDVDPLPEGGDRRLDVALEPLDEAECQTFASRYFNAEVDDGSLISKLQGASGGAPVLMEQLLDVLVESGVATPDWDGWSFDRDRLADIDVPNDSRELLTTRLQTVSEAERDLCRTAAVWGDSFPIPPVAEALGEEARVARNRAEAALRHGLLLRVGSERDASRGDEEARYEFVHASVRRALLEEMSSARRRSIHQVYAERLDDREDWSFLMAEHYRDGDGSRPERVFDTCRTAGLRAAENYAFERARTFLDAALEVSEEVEGGPAAELYHRLGQACAALGETERALEAFERAADRSENSLQEARARLGQARIEAGRVNIAGINDSIEPALELLDDPMPSSTPGRLMLALYRFVQVVFWRRVRTPTPVEDEAERERRFLRSRAHEMVAFAGRFEEDEARMGAALTSRLSATIPLGATIERIHALGSEATAFAFGGAVDAASERFERTRELAGDVDDPRVEPFLEFVEVAIDDLGGRPLRAASNGAELASTRLDQLRHWSASIMLTVLCSNFSVRGKSREVERWFAEWKSLHDVESQGYPPSALYTIRLIHARLRGEDEVANDIRELESREPDATGNPFIERATWSGVIMDEALGSTDPTVVDDAIERVRELGVSPSDVLYGKYFYIYAIHALRAILDDQDRPDDRRLRQLGELVDDAEEGFEGHPAFEAHVKVGRAELLHYDGAREEAFAELGRAEAVAQRVDNAWVLVDVERCRASWLDEAGGTERARRHAASALEQARELGWTPTAEEIRVTYELPRARSSRPESGRRATARGRGRRTDQPIDTGSVTSRQIELERKLDALLEVSTATSSIIDPEEVSRVVVDAAIRVLGAQRGMLFLGEATDRDIAETDPTVVRTAEGDGPDDVSISRTILREVVETDEPLVLRRTAEGAELGAESVVADEMRSVMAAPLRLEDELVGVIYLDNHLASGVFDAEDVEILQAVANHIPFALETAKTAQLEVDVATERERREYAENLRAFTETINGLMDVRDIFVRLLDEALEIVSADEASVAHLVDGDLRVECRLEEGAIERAPFEDEPRLESGAYVEEALDSKSTQFLTEIDDEIREREPSIPSGSSSWGALPLVSGDEVVGLMILSDVDTDRLDPADLEHLVALAGQTGLAVEKTELATVDPLTDVYNRRKFFELAEDAFDRATRTDDSLTALMIDCDNFEEINDRYGHTAGDAVLEEVAQRYRRTLRDADILGRYGGDEFAVVLPGADVDEAVEYVTERLRESVAERPVRTESGAEFDVTVSIGVAGRRDGDETVDEVLERADDAVYAAKSAGRNRVATCDDAGLVGPSDVAS